VGDRRVRLDENLLFLAVGQELGGGVARVHEQLVDVRDHRAVLQDVLQVGLLEVGDPDRADLGCLVGLLQRPPRLTIALGVGAARKSSHGCGEWISIRSMY
jgi:hypothetical protein